MNLITPDSNPKHIDYLGGAVLLIDKPKDWTSFDVVNKIRHSLRHFLDIRKIKVGHAGTLDPMATGLLIICTGKMTKSINKFQDLDKEYEGTMILGGITASYDAETPIEQSFPIDSITEELLIKNTDQFIGDIEQIPPMYSAIKIKGQALYKLARKGETVERKARSIRIQSFRLLNFNLPELDFYVHCSKGTYIRTLAYDFGKSLNNGAYLSRLVRTSIGEFQLKNAWNLSDFIQKINE